jgi:subtilisin
LLNNLQPAGEANVKFNLKIAIQERAKFWNSSVVSSLVAIGSISPFGTIHFSALAQSQPHTRYIVKSKDLNLVSESIRKHGGNILRRLEITSGLVVEIPAVAAVSHIVNEVADAEFILDVEMKLPPHTIHAQGRTTSPPPQQTPWGAATIHAPQAHALTKGAGVTVCVVDSGVDKTHADLQGNISGGRNFVWAKGKLDSNAFDDENGHGTHVSGTIAALDNSVGSVGIAPEAKIYAVKVLNRQGSGYLSDVADGVLECVLKGANVINMSLGATSDPSQDSPLKTAIDQALAAGVKVIVAAGNEGQDIANTIPAGFPSTIAVAAVDSALQFPSWSNFGLQSDDLSAPGVNIYSTWKGGGYNTISGTSMASPHVAGVAALMIAAQKVELSAIDLGVQLFRQGAGLIDALLTVSNL